MFQLTTDEYDFLRYQPGTLKNIQNLKSQIATSSWGGKRKNPFAFHRTRRSNACRCIKKRNRRQDKYSNYKCLWSPCEDSLPQMPRIFQRLDTVWAKATRSRREFQENIQRHRSKKRIIPKQGIFFNGQIFDAYKFVSDLFRTAKKSIVIIDNYIDDTVLCHLAKRHENVTVTIFNKINFKAFGSWCKEIQWTVSGNWN